MVAPFTPIPRLMEMVCKCRRKQNALIQAVEERLEQWTLLPLENQEDMQILRYAAGQKYGAHYDSLDKDSPRIATVLLYLRANNLEGGETAFPVADKWIGSGKERGPFSECAEGHVAAKPRKGDALLFYSLTPDGGSDSASLHTGGSPCSVGGLPGHA
jgi:prolyl 4-hydroxylase